ncbi:uncharacterized protein LOC114515935 [Dendronephthya gigantea]|uniref:uncharacterized protein LOC114515935 n=1 Tax=Dendronephthya gigantea TaxID=151771 RepID=UPI00106CF5A7|nr:uncharacterized protein LOC114515935 [Dendronephthya gigantea]
MDNGCGHSLARLCLETVAENIALACENSAINGCYVYSEVAFSQLNGRHIQEILDIAFSKGILSQKHFGLLVHPNVLKLDLSKYSHSLVTDQVLLQLPCKKLVSLNLQNCDQISSQCLNQSLQNLPCLTNLNLSHCLKCCDSVLENIAKCCPNLEKLNLEMCQDVTDRGIQAFLKPFTSSAKPPKISHLNVSSTSVTTTSFLILLNGLPLLHSLSFAQLLGTKKLSSANCNSIEQKHVQFQLQHLDMLGTQFFYYQIGQVDLILQNCHNLRGLKLSFEIDEPDVHNYPEVFFMKTAKHPTLESFHLSALQGPHLQSQLFALRYFEFERIENYLKEIDNQLTSLHLADVKNLKISTFFNFNSLKHLTLSRCQFIQPLKTSAKLSDFCSLQYIGLESLDFQKEISLDLKQKFLYQQLMSHPKLLRLSLRSVPIEEEYLMKILRSSSGLHLEELILSCYDNVIVNTIGQIEKSCPNLKRLELNHCWVVTWYDICQFNERMKTIGRELEVVTNEQNDLI